MRNDANEVVAMDRSGLVDIVADGALRVEVARHGRMTAAADMRQGADIRWQRVN